MAYMISEGLALMRETRLGWAGLVIERPVFQPDSTNGWLYDCHKLPPWARVIFEVSSSTRIVLFLYIKNIIHIYHELFSNTEI